MLKYQGGSDADGRWRLPGGAGSAVALPEWTRLRALAARYRWFLLIVAAPTLTALLYFGLIAADIYLAEAKYVVRSAQSERPSVLGNVLQNVGLASSQDDTYSVRDFILSRDMVRRLEQRDDLRAILSRPEGDFVTRFPSPLGGRSFEQLYEAYGNFVSVNVDETTGISDLRVRAYRPEDSNRLAKAILNYSEDLINRLNDRARHDAIDVATREVTTYERRVTAAQAAITAYRLKNQMLDPQSTSGAVLALIARLQADLTGSQALLSETMSTSPGSPQIEPLRQHIAALQREVDSESRKVVGGSGSVASKIGEYERLLLEREFADKSLLAATTALESARVEAQRKQLYLDRVVEPNLPDYALYPERLISILEVVLSCLLVYGIGWLVSASVREHVGR
ncbi:MAG TPA: hypothetical protein VGB91_15720 [Rhizomicrobium sp.]